MDSMALYYPVNHQKHYFYAHPERPDRVEVMKTGLEEINLWEESSLISPDQVEDRILAAIHDQSYLNLLELASSKEQMLDPDTYTTKESWLLALNAAGGGVALVDAVWERRAKTGFALTRPPGHHAT
ncbi:MAG: hypothetical protein HQ574_00055, partial [Chloroflexi bacterium]|nr:hypothetical protein [Chloroflexota bacterium]